LNPLILGYLLAFVVHPLVLRLERRGWERRKAVNFIFTAFALAFVALAFVIFLQGRGLARELSVEQGLRKKVSERVDQALVEYKDEINWVVRLFRESKDQKGSTSGRGDETANAGGPGRGNAEASDDVDSERILGW